MKRKSIFLICCLIFVVSMFGTLFACDIGTTDSAEPEEATAILAEIINLPDKIQVGEFDNANVTCRISYDDGTYKDYHITTSVLPEEGVDLINTVGEHEINILYRGFEVSFTVKIVNENYLVRFINAKDEIIKQVTYSPKNPVNIVPPTAEEMAVDGYRFVGFDKEFTSITKDTDIHGEYVKTWTVRFYNALNQLISIQTIDDGKDAVAVSESQIKVDGYEFIGWDEEFTNVHNDLVIKGIYEKLCIVRFFNGKNVMINSQYVKVGEEAIEPDASLIDVPGYEFVSWDKSFTNIVSDVDIYGIYEKEYSKGLKYEKKSDSTYMLSGIGECKDVNVVVPSEHEGKPVTAVKENAFLNCEILVTIILPDSIVEIGDKAFSGCTALVEIIMPEEVEIGTDVFRGSINVEIKIKHILKFVEAKEASCEEPGNVEHYACVHCGQYYKDKECTQRIYDVIIPASHDFKDGICTKCGEILSSIKIVSVGEIPYLGKFPLGTLENAIGLPNTVNVKTADGKTHELAVQWDLSDYKKNQVGEYTIKGHLQAGVLIFAEGVSSDVEAQIEIVETMKGTADIVFILDTSGSMGGEISNVKNNIVKLATAIEEKGVSARWGVVDYSDWEDVSGEDTRIIMNATSPWFITAEECKKAIENEVKLRNGGDNPELAVDGLMAAFSMETRKDARTFYVLVTDANYKNDNKYGVKNMNEAITKLQSKDVHVSVVTNSTYSSYYRSLVEETGGLMSTNISGNFMNALYNELVEKIYEEVIA